MKYCQLNIKYKKKFIFLNFVKSVFIYNILFIFLNIIKITFIYSLLFIFFYSTLISNDLISGYHFSEPSTQEIQDDDFLNPGFLWVERGKKIWLEKKIKKKIYFVSFVSWKH